MIAQAYAPNRKVFATQRQSHQKTPAGNNTRNLGIQKPPASQGGAPHPNTIVLWRLGHMCGRFGVPVRHPCIVPLTVWPICFDFLRPGVTELVSVRVCVCVYAFVCVCVCACVCVHEGGELAGVSVCANLDPARSWHTQTGTCTHACSTHQIKSMICEHLA